MRILIISICLLFTSSAFSQFQENSRFVGGNFSFFYTADQHEFSSLNSNLFSLAAYPQYGRFLSDKWAFAFLAGVNWTRDNALASESIFSFEGGVTPFAISQVNSGNFGIGTGQRYFTRTETELDFRVMPSFRHYKMFNQRIGLISEIGTPVNYCVTSYGNRDNNVSSTGVGTSRRYLQDYHQLSLAVVYVPRFLFMLNDKWGLEAAIGSLSIQYDLDKRGDNSFKGNLFTASANLTQRFNIGIRYYFAPSSL
ncbi:MAG: hypothetical protein AAF806_09010 [Bacteroidota bacterium]